MTSPNTAGLVERLRAVVDAHGNTALHPYCLYAQAADALLAQAAELTEARAEIERLVRINAEICRGSNILNQGGARLERDLSEATRQRDEALAALKASEWQPIETAPKDGTVVLLRIPGEHPRVEAAFWNLGSGAEPDPQFPWTTLDGVYGTNGYGEDRPDGWGPLPSPQGRLPNLADATNNPPSDPGTEQREAGV